MTFKHLKINLNYLNNMFISICKHITVKTVFLTFPHPPILVSSSNVNPVISLICVILHCFLSIYIHSCIMGITMDLTYLHFCIYIYLHTYILVEAYSTIFWKMLYKKVLLYSNLIVCIEGFYHLLCSNFYS